MRSRLKAELISERLRGKEPSEVLKLDPELKEIERLSSLLETVSVIEFMPSTEVQRRMRERVMECHRQVAEGKKPREGDPSRRVSVLEPQRISYATLAAAAILAVIMVASAILFTAPGKVPVPPFMGLAEAEAWIFATGKVEVLSPGGEWTERETPLVAREGSSLRTPDGVRAEVAFGDGNQLRLNYGGEVGIDKVGEGGIAVSLRSGEGYFRARKGTPFEVLGRGVEVRALGTAFDMDLGGERTEVLALLDDLEVASSPPRKTRSRLEEGEMLDLPLEPGDEGVAPYILDIPQERLRDEWLTWNREIDASRGLDLGVLSEVEPQVVPMPGISPMAKPGEQVTNPDNPDNQDGGQIKPTITLRGAPQGQGVALSWELKDGEASAFILLRAEGREPVYPQDSLVNLDSDMFSYLDGQVKEGRTYTYRMAIEHEGGVIYSNAVTASIPKAPSSITLRGRVVDPGQGNLAIEVTWHVEGTVDAEYYVLVRAERDQSPVYPPSGSMISFRFPVGRADYIYTDDANLYMGYTYNYRVFAIKGGMIVLDSNVASVYIDTSVITK